MSLFINQSNEEEQLARRFHRLRNAGFVILVAATVIMLSLVLSRVNHRLELSRQATSERVTWAVAQVEVELLKFQRAVIASAADLGSPQSLERARQAFDVLYNRFDVLEHGLTPEARSSGLPLPRLPPEADAFVQQLVPVFDGPDAGLAAAMPEIAQALPPLIALSRQYVVQMFQQTMNRRDSEFTLLRQSLQTVVVFSISLLGMMAALTFMILLLGRVQSRRIEVSQRAMHNLRMTIESSLDCVLIVKANGRITDCNHAGELLLGWPRNCVEGMFVTDILGYLDDRPDHLDLNDLCLDSSEFADKDGGRFRLKAIRAEGDAVPVEVALTHARGTGGEPMFIAFIHNIAARLEHEENLRSARNDALQGQEAKARFLAVMSHEMRTPLNGLIAATELMQSSSSLDERQTWLSEIVLSCGWAALDQVNNVLEMTRLGSDRYVSYPAAEFSPVQVIRDLILQNQLQASKRGNVLVFDECEAEAPPVQASRQLFARVLYNLVGNAIKFTDNGVVTVRLESESWHDEGKVLLRVSVADTGIGIAEDDLIRVFNNFETLDSSYARMREGTGLGLGIAKLSAEAMGGEIRVKSVPGQGSIFTFEVNLPIGAGMTAASASVDENGAEECILSILIAEDNPINSLLLTEMLRLRGHQVTATADGMEAVDRAKDTRFDLILMDIAMPRMDGLEATRRIRSNGASRDVPIVGVTANASPDQLPDFLGAGMSDVLVKPITRGALQALIENHVRIDTRFRPPPKPRVIPENLVLDAEVLNETVEEMGRDFVESIATRLMAEMTEVTDQLYDLSTNGNLADAGQVAHKAAGAAAAIGLRGLHDALTQFEGAAAQHDVAAAGQALGRVHVIVPFTAAALQERGVLPATANALAS
jgi:PAS domain S-box-containing protein